MTLKLNNNIPAINAHRSLLVNDRKINKILEQISTGLEVVRGGDGPAALVLSEQLRSQIKGLNQAISNSESAISMVQTTEAALEEVSRLLVDLRKLAVHASNDAANDKLSLQADQQEVDNIIEALDRIAQQTSFGSRKLLDGSGGVNGVGIGEGLSFVSGTVSTQASPAEGYEVRIVEPASRATFVSESIPDTEFIDEVYPEAINVSEGGKSIKYDIKQFETADNIANNLNTMLQSNGLDITVTVVEDDKLMFQHNQYGSKASFFVGSTNEGFISEAPNTLQMVNNGFDVIGSIGGYSATGDGIVLTGDDNTPIAGLKVRYEGIPLDFDENGSLVGNVLVLQNSLLFQLGAESGEVAKVNLGSTYARDLARGINNDSNFQSIADIDLTSFQGAQDALKLVVAASNDISSLRGRLGSLQRNSLEATNNYLRNYVENISAAESTIRDADIAAKSAEFIKTQIQLQASSAAVIHANNSPKTIVQLLNAIQ